MCVVSLFSLLSSLTSKILAHVHVYWFHIIPVHMYVCTCILHSLFLPVFSTWDLFSLPFLTECTYLLTLVVHVIIIKEERGRSSHQEGRMEGRRENERGREREEKRLINRLHLSSLVQNSLMCKYWRHGGNLFSVISPPSYGDDHHTFKHDY